MYICKSQRIAANGEEKLKMNTVSKIAMDAKTQNVNDKLGSLVFGIEVAHIISNAYTAPVTGELETSLSDDSSEAAPNLDMGSMVTEYTC